jgi:hypothetical protein
MPIDFGVAGFSIPQHERVSLVIAGVGGPTKAAALTGRSRAHIDNMRKLGAPLRLDDLLPLCEAAGVSLDWVATGYQVRPDLVAMHEERGVEHFDGDLPSFRRLLPARPDEAVNAARSVERQLASEIAVSAAWLDSLGHLTSETARYAIAGDEGMAPVVGQGALVVVDIRPARPRSGLYLVDLGDELAVRRLAVMPGQRYELTADALPNWRAPLPEGGGNLGRVVWAGQAF